MHKFFYVLPFVCLISACGPGETTPTETGATGEALPTTTQAEEEIIGSIRTIYSETTARLKAGSLEKDSLEYSCEEIMLEGKLTAYADAGGTLLVENSFSQGDHFGQTDHWYFRDGELVFLFQEAGSWQFGGPLSEDEEGNEMPGTVDEITENRLYFDKGVLVKHLEKSYKIESWKEEVNPEAVPNETVAHNGELPDNYTFIAAFMATRKVDCGLLE